MRRKSTLHLTLALIGVVTLSACDSDQKRHVYRSRQDCLDDWGDGKACEEPPPGSGHFGSGYWYGPRWSGSTRHGSRAISSVTVSRGGFGRFGGIHSAFGG